MATTTNYSWSTPDDTALVKDGAAAIRTLGSSIDTTTKALNPSTTLGDFEYRSATANTNTRLPIGTSGQVLQVNGSGVPAWATASAGGLTVLASGSLTGTSVSLTSISGSYKDLLLFMNNISISSNAVPRVGFNSLSSGCAQGSNFLYFGTSPTATYDFINPFANRALDAAYSTGTMYVRFQNYTATTPKTFYAAGTGFDQSAGGLTYGHQFGFLDSISAVTSIQMMASSGAFDNGTYILYGVS